MRAGQKLPFCAELDVDEVLLGEYQPVERSGLIELGPTELAERLDWP